MKNATQCAKRLSALLKKLPAVDAVEGPNGDDPITTVVFSFLLWESTTVKASAAYKSIFENVVDFNDLRVCMPQEIMELIGARYPRSLDRCQRLRAVLRDIYSREHCVSLDRVKNMGKRDARKYIESLEGIVPYVSARIMLLAFQTHAVPVDDQLRTNLIEAGAADTSAENAELSSWLERQIKATDGVAAHMALQAWVDDRFSKAAAPAPVRTAKKTRRNATSKKTAASNGSARKTKTPVAKKKTKKS